MDSASFPQLALLDEHAAGWRVRRSLRARRLAVRVFRDGGVEVVAPQRATAGEVEAFVARHREWIDRQLARHAVPASEFPPPVLELAALGERWTCEVVPATRRGQVEALAAEPEGAGEDSRGGVLRLPASADAARQRELLMGWLVQRAGDTLVGPLMALAQGLGLPLRQVQVRRQRTRWGSCSSRGTITLNACLLFQPPEVVRYLYLHELTHMRHMNHSARFWAAVERLEPGWRGLDRQLVRGWQRVPGWVLAHLRA